MGIAASGGVGFSGSFIDMIKYRAVEEQKTDFLFFRKCKPELN